MAVGNSTNAIYYSISDGKICRQFKEPTANSKTRVNKNGKTVHEEFYDFIDGIITAIGTKDSDYGKFWMVTISDGDQSQVLQFNYSSGYANAFLKCLPNIDLNSKVKIIPSLKMEGDKKKTALFITQHGQPVKWYYTKDNPNGLPELKQIKVKGKITWDDSDSMEFLEKMVMTEIVPKLPKSGGAQTAESKSHIEVIEVEAEEIGTDDLPF